MIRIKIKEMETCERRVVLRMPFRFGVITLTEEPELFLRVRIETEAGGSSWGAAAEALAPKWFDKNPALSNEDNFEQLRTSLKIAASVYRSEDRLETPFRLSAYRYETIRQLGLSKGLNLLVSGFGPAIIDRAVLDAVCRIQQVGFVDALRENLPGLELTPFLPELTHFDWKAFLSSRVRADSVHARHTVGLVDPIRTCDIAPADRINDGLPESLEEVARTYRNVYYKLKLSGEIEADLERLQEIAKVLDDLDWKYRVTLDGNEQYRTAAEIEEVWERMNREPALRDLVRSVLFIEQPIHRDAAFLSDLSSLSDRCPVIIDESDEDYDAFPRAVRCGYRGVSSKQCKGLYKSIINSARCVEMNRSLARPIYFMSGEDLTTQPGLALQQDLLLAVSLGITHLERNGHHYVRGLSDLPESEQEAFLAAHPDLYIRDGDLVRVDIRKGKMKISSLHAPGFGYSAEPDWERMDMRPL